MKNRIQSLIAKVKVRKLRILHWLAVIGLSVMLFSLLSGVYGDSSKHIQEGAERKQILVFDLTTGEQVPAIVIADKPASKKDDKGKKDQVAAPVAPKKSEIMLIVSDLGSNSTSTEKALSLPKNVLLSFSPYAEASLELSQRAKEGGHNVMVDLPVQMKEAGENTGNLLMTVENSEFKNRNNFEAAVSKVSEPSGVLVPPADLFSLSNNFTPILRQMGNARLFLIYGGESEDIDQKAKDSDVGMLKVDVVIDEGKNSEDIAKQIANAEATAAKSGFAVILVQAPSAALIDQLNKWTGTFKEKNISLVSSLK